MFCTKFKLSANRIQFLNVITGLGFTIRHWHILFVKVYILVVRYKVLILFVVVSCVLFPF